MRTRGAGASPAPSPLAVAARSGIDATFQVLFNGVDPLNTPADCDVVTFCEHLSGHGSGCVNFGTEAPFFTTLGAQSVVCGPGDIDLAHQPNEYLDLRQVAPARQMIASLIDRYCRRPDAL